MARPSYLLLIILLFFAALLAIQVASTGGEAERAGPVVLRMGGGPSAKGAVDLSGQVIDAVGWPVAGACVTAAQNVAGATTDAEGRFRLRVAENEAVSLTVAARTGMHGRAAAVLPQEDSVVLVAEPQLPWTVGQGDEEPVLDSRLAGEGLVKDEDGRPVPRAVVIVPETGVCVRANEHGRYRVSLPLPPPVPGGKAVFHLIARDQSRVVRAEVAYTAQRQGLRPLPTLQVVAGHRVAGFLKDGSGEPVNGAGLVLSGQGQVRRVVTGGDGEFGIQGLLAGDYQLSALPHRGWVGFHRELSVGEGAPQDVELRLRAERPLTILAEDEAGEPQADVHVVAREMDYRVAHGRTDARGRVILRGLGDRKLTFAAHRTSDYQELAVVRYDAREQRLILGR